MRLTVVGSGTAAPEADRVCSGFFVEAGTTRILLDCGPGVVHHLARFELAWERLDHVVLSHFHNDHIGDLPMLLFALKWGVAERRTAPLAIWGPAGLHDRMRRLTHALGEHVSDPGFPLEVREVGPGRSVPLADPGDVLLSAHATPHTDASLAYRIHAGGRTLGYTGDTGASDDVARFLAGVDVMIAECSVPDDAPLDGHLSPSGLAAMATAAAPGRLVVTHVYPALARRDVAALIRDAGWSGETVRAVDGLSIDVGG